MFVEALELAAEFEQVGAAGLGVPLVYNWVEGGSSPALSAREVTALGHQILLLPISLLLAATQAMERTLGQIRVSGTTAPGAFGDEPFTRFTAMIGLPELLEAEARYRDI